LFVTNLLYVNGNEIIIIIIIIIITAGNVVA
jgi:hypothetical protein